MPIELSPAQLPEALPARVPMAGYFLQAIDTPVWIWIIRILLVAVLAVCLCYALRPLSVRRGAPDDASPETDQEEDAE